MKNLKLAKAKSFIFLLFLLIIVSETVFAQGGNDAAFNPGDLGYGLGDGPNAVVYASSIQSDGKIIIGGGFITYNGNARKRIARLNTDGSLDATFTPGAGANGIIYAIAIQSNGKILIGGEFNNYNGTARNYIARLNADGSLDDTFDPGTGADAFVYSISIQSDGKIIISGEFTNYNEIGRNYVARLNSDGSLDPTFAPGTIANGIVRKTAVQGDGKIIIGGEFTMSNGASSSYHYARLNSDGTKDAAFTTAASGDFVRTLAIQSDGKIILSDYSEFIVRINSDGTLDDTFDPEARTDGAVYSFSIQSDGKILIGGEFGTCNGTERNCIARLNADGSLDDSFDPGTGAASIVNAISIQSDGKIIIGGEFVRYNNMGRKYFTRLNSGGSLDASFNPGTGADNGVYATVIQSDGKIIIGGEFTFYNNTCRNYIARLNTDGSLDETFNPGTGADSRIMALAIQSDGKLIIGGSFSSYNGTGRNFIARLKTDGSLDATFDPGTGTDYDIEAISIQSDGKIIIGGAFTLYNGTHRNYIARLNSTGSLDATFVPVSGANLDVWTTAVQSDGKIIIGGMFTYYDGIARNHIARLNADGSLDDSFIPGTGANNNVDIAAIQSDGKIIIGGAFSKYNGTSRNRISRLKTDGSLDDTFIPGTGASGDVITEAIQSDGKVIIGGSFTSYNGTGINHIARLNSDGSLDAAFNPGLGANKGVSAIAIQSDEKIVIGGVFTSYDDAGRNRIARILTEVVTTTNSIEFQNVTLYPNPSKGSIFVDNASGAMISVYGLTGNILLTKSNVTDHAVIDLTDFPAGVYLVKVNMFKTSKVFKVVLNN
jgi:uncharacterized delta-60 repeat protein